MKKAAFQTLGCKVNQYESEAMAGLFRKHGYEIVDFNDRADVYVINTCTVTHLGDRKSRQMIRRAKRNNPQATVAVTGCYAQTSPGEVTAIEGVDLVLGTGDKGKIIEYLGKIEQEKNKEGPISYVKDIMEVQEFEEFPLLDYQSRTRAFLKIQEGCNNFCTYCIIPYARGPLRSRDKDNIISEAKRLIDEGFREFVLSGIHTGAYGKETGEDIDLAVLVKELAELPGLKRLRLGSIEPEDVNLRLIETVENNPVICRHFHLPLQSGDDTVLKKMKRRYDTFQFRNLVDNIRSKIDDVAITTDIIVGFPGEDDGMFENTYNFVKALEFSRLHVFKYSPRKGTPAADYPGQVNAKVKDKRSRRLIELGEKLAHEFVTGFLGQEIEVLAEQPLQGQPGLMEGLTDNYLQVTFPGEEELKGKFVRVKLKEVKENYIYGELSD